jgi:hypothetical protein
MNKLDADVVKWLNWTYHRTTRCDSCKHHYDRYAAELLLLNYDQVATYFTTYKQTGELPK